MEATGWRRGIAWKNEKLYAFEPGSILVMRLWPDMLAWRRTRTKPWAATRKWADQLMRHPALEPGYLERYQHLRHEAGGPPEFSDLMDGFKLSLQASLAALSTIPERERRLASRFTDRRWHALALMARCPGAADLMDANPALGFSLANSWVVRDAPVTQPMRSARSLICKPQVHIMEWLGFEPSERVRRILKRIEPAALSGRRLPQLRRALANPNVQGVLAHLPDIRAEVLPFVTHHDSMERITTRFLLDVMEHASPRPLVGVDCSESSYRLWSDARRMANLLNEDFPASLRSVTQLKRWHDDLVARYNQVATHVTEAQGAIDPTASFPPPPFPCSPGLEPILSNEALLDEGRQMSHCVGSYGSAIAAGQYAVFRVTAPVRATLGLRLQRGSWQVDQIRGPKNQRISARDSNQIVERLMSANPGASDV